MLLIQTVCIAKAKEKIYKKKNQTIQKQIYIKKIKAGTSFKLDYIN